MNMTHYMALLADNQPWNLLFFMAVPIILAETVAITELAVLFNRSVGGAMRALNRWAGLIGGFYFAGVFVYLMKEAAIPLTLGGGWRGPAPGEEREREDPEALQREGRSGRGRIQWRCSVRGGAGVGASRGVAA